MIIILIYNVLFVRRGESCEVFFGGSGWVSMVSGERCLLMAAKDIWTFEEGGCCCSITSSRVNLINSSFGVL